MTTKSPSMRARWLYRVLFTNGRAYRGRHWYDAADWFKARGWPLLLAALLLALSACGAWEDGAAGQPTPAGYIWIPDVPTTPEPLPTAPPSANEANVRQNQCIWALEDAHTTLNYEQIVNGCNKTVQEAPAP